MNARPSRAEIWQVDMGIAGKVRPCLLLTDYPANDELALVTVIPHTTALRGNEWEVGRSNIFSVNSVRLTEGYQRFFVDLG
jgi:mRNA-degrading endonuclease toxin of MazEF toxin-antitoxin module